MEEHLMHVLITFHTVTKEQGAHRAGFPSWWTIWAEHEKLFFFAHLLELYSQLTPTDPT